MMVSSNYPHTDLLRRSNSGRKRGEAIKFSLCKSPLDDNVFPFI